MKYHYGLNIFGKIIYKLYKINYTDLNHTIAQNILYRQYSIIIHIYINFKTIQGYVILKKGGACVQSYNI